MAWGKTVGVASWVERLPFADASLTSVTDSRSAVRAGSAAAVSAALRTNTPSPRAVRPGYASPCDAATAATLAEALAENTTVQLG